MICLRAEELLSDSMEGELHDLLRRELEEHLQRCADCSALLAALGEVVGVLRAGRARHAELQPSPALAARAAQAALRAGRVARLKRAWTLPRPLQAVAATLALLATGAVLAGRSAFAGGWHQRALHRATAAGVQILETRDRVVEELRMVRVVVGATFAGRVDRVTERMDDYRRLLERRRSAEPPEPPAPAVGPQPGAGAAAPAARPEFANREPDGLVTTG